jgi:hypothetical protein
VFFSSFISFSLLLAQFLGTASREAALNAAVHAVNRLCETIDVVFGIHIIIGL